MSNYRKGDDIRYCEVDGFGVVLDLATQRYSMLDAPAAAAWAVLTGEASAAAHVERWVENYDVSTNEALAAITTFGADCVRRGWLRTDGDAGQAVRKLRPACPARLGRWRPCVALAVWALIATALSLRFRGFSRTYDELAHAPIVHAGTTTRLDKAAEAFLLAENFIFFRRGINDCLVRSLALFRYLRGIGIAATHVIGIRRAPFAAHAWVESNGEGVLAPAPRGYARIAELMPPE